ncbi:MAG: MFS transporter [Candidatus Bathyarchaeota archaeon]|jgi:MFS family permease|nr:MFS transporter [Candidatus Bathyarchaeota archaeon A05DMB-3]MDH7606194.1 MFS transporter [Candidatus Bathyarchaeota archaeon]
MLKYVKNEFSFIFGNVFILLVVWAFTDFAHLLPDTYYSLYVESLGGSPLTIGSILSASLFIMAFLQLAGGYWADKRGRKALIIGASFARTLIYIVFATAPTWHFIILGELLIGVVTIAQPAMSALVADSRFGSRYESSLPNSFRLLAYFRGNASKVEGNTEN